MKKYFLLLVAMLLLHCQFLTAQTKSLLDTQIPDIQFDKVLNSDLLSASLNTFADKAILLDFWATWCAPCIKAFDHLEALQKEFPDDLLVMTVTSEDEKRITQFLTKFETSLPIAIDNERKISEAFPHRTIPHSVLIDKNGIIRVISSPNMITSDVVQRVVNQEDVKIAEKQEKLDFNPSEPLSGTHNVLFQITLTPY